MSPGPLASPAMGNRSGRLIRAWLPFLLLVVCRPIRVASAQSTRAVRSQPDSSMQLQSSIQDGFALAAVGDIILTQPVSMRSDPGLQSAIAILRNADVAFGNFESTAIDIRRFTGHPQADNGGLWTRSDPSVIPDLRAMAFSIVSRANNHALDWGPEGMRETDRRLDSVGIVHAGTGESHAAAAAAGYLATPRGTVAIVSGTTMFSPEARAMDPLGEAPGRPGVNALRTTQYVVAPQPTIASLRRIYGDLVGQRAVDTTRDLEFFGTHFRGNDTLRHGMAYTAEVDTTDVRDLMRRVLQAKLTASFVIVTLHAHDAVDASGGAPADYLSALAHAAIDHGADAFIVHGPHVLGGIEIYRGKPIYYSLGNFVFELSQVAPVARDGYEEFQRDPQRMVDAEFQEEFRMSQFNAPIWYESIIAVSRYDRGCVSEIELHPLELQFTAVNADRGIPRVAPPAIARAILARLQRISQSYGTLIEIRDNVGIIRPASDHRSAAPTVPPSACPQ